MNFFVPVFEDDAMLVWNVVHNALGERWRFARLRRIQALLREGDPEDWESVIVGEDLPGGRDHDPVLVILESEAFAGLMYFVCTLSMLVEKLPPAALALATGWQVVEFDDPLPFPVPVPKPAPKAKPEPKRSGRK